jgi:hypothetical protein
MDFDDHPDDKTDFVRYAVKLRCLNPIVHTKKSPLPPLEDLAETVEALMAVGLKAGQGLSHVGSWNNSCMQRGPYDSGSLI